MMKKKFLTFTVIIILVLVIPINASAKSPLVIDNSGVFSAEELDYLLYMADSVTGKYGIDTAIYITDHVAEYNLGDYCDKLCVNLGYSNDCSIFLIALDDGNYYYYNHGIACKAITDYGSKYIDDNIIGYLRNGNFYKAASTYLTLSSEFYNEYLNTGNAYDINNKPNFLKTALLHLLGSSAVGLMLAGIPIVNLKKKMISVKPKNNAADYADYQHFRLNIKSDKFITKHVSSVPIPRQNYATNGPASHGGTTMHTSSMGRTYSGHGGSFKH